ncbi:MAG: Uma2 family endonuclease [Ktedonobacteraceae bacterium]|nr:Uma2 family endonuclease [Ktedonobacteraceae bacterium]
MELERTPIMSAGEYFEIEEDDPDVHYEYLDGYVYLMLDTTANHATISGNIYAILKGLLRGSPCRVYNSDMKVRVSAQCCFLPDVTVTCDPRDRGNAEFIQSPHLVVEVLSPSTEAHDRGRKLQCYFACPSIEQCLLVDTRAMRIETYRKEEKKWLYDAFEADEEIELATLGIRFRVADAYEDVIF